MPRKSPDLTAPLFDAEPPADAPPPQSNEPTRIEIVYVDAPTPA